MLERKWWTLIAVCVATFMLLLDVTIVNVALPDIQRSLGSSFSDLQWVVDAYALTLATFLLTAGSVADRLGRRRVFSVGLVLFTLASLLCGLATGPLFLNLARGAQGIGAAMMFATSLSLLAQAFSGRDRGTAFGVWGATTGLAVAIGPLVGGALTQGIGWESIFFLNVPIGAAALALTLLRVEESSDPHGGRVDLAGLVTFSGALGMLVFGLIRGNDLGWGSATIVGLLAGAGVLLAVFVAVELRVRHPMLELALFRKPAFAGASIAAFGLSASMFAMFLYLTLYIQNVLGFSPLETGIRFLPVSLLSFLVAPVAGRLSAQLPVRLFLGGGLALVAVGLGLMHGIDAGSGWADLLPGFIVAGIGVGLTNPPLASTAIGVVPPAQSGMASGINSTFRQVGIATGIAALGALFQARVQSKVATLLAGTPVGGGRSAELSGAISSGRVGAVIAHAPPEARAALGRAARTGFVDGLGEILLVAAAVAAVSAVLSLALVRSRDFAAGTAQAERRPVEQPPVPAETQAGAPVA